MDSKTNEKPQNESYLQPPLYWKNSSPQSFWQIFLAAMGVVIANVGMVALVTSWQINSLEVKMNALESRLMGEINALEGRFIGEIGELKGNIKSIEGSIKSIELQVFNHIPTQIKELKDENREIKRLLQEK